jgi:TonB family protein
MQTKRLVILLLITTSLLMGITASQRSVWAQSGGDPDWQTLRPEGEEFTIVMPREPKVEESQEPYHRMTLNTRLYLSATEHGPVFAVVSLSGIKSNPAMYTESERLNSYVDAFKNWFPQKVRKDAPVKLTLVGDKMLNGNSGREYRLTIGELSGTAHVFATRRRFYAVVVLNTKKDDALTDRFLSSFVLPEKIKQAPPTVAALPNTPAKENPANPRPERKENSDDTQKIEPTSEEGTVAKPNEAAATEKTKPGEKAPINGGVLNGKALVLPQPEYPAIAKQANASGVVVVQVIVDEQGSVVFAHAIAGHPLLQAASVKAAREAKFAPTTLMGEPVKVAGTLTYNFGALN